MGVLVGVFVCVRVGVTVGQDVEDGVIGWGVFVMVGVDVGVCVFVTDSVGVTGTILSIFEFY